MDPLGAEQTVQADIPASAEGEMWIVALLFAEGGGFEVMRPFKRFHPTLGSTFTSVLEGLANGDPCANVPMRRVPEEVRNVKAQDANPSFLGGDPSAI